MLAHRVDNVRYDFEDLIWLDKVNPEDTGSSGLSDGRGVDNTGYGHHLLEFEAQHHLVIYNGMAQWLGSGGLTCFPARGGSSTVDYVLGSQEAAKLVTFHSITQPHKSKPYLPSTHPSRLNSTPTT